MNILVATPAGATRDTFITKENAAFLKSLGHVVWNEGSTPWSRDQWRDALEDMDVVVSAWGIPRFDDDLLQKADHLKLVAYLCGSVNHIVSDEMYARGIRIVCGNEIFAQSLAEGTLAYILSALRRIPEYTAIMQRDGWKPPQYGCEALSYQTVGIVGLGATSRYLIELLKPFHVDIKVCSQHTPETELEKLGARKASLEDIFSTCKVVSLHVARRPENYHMVNDALLSRMQPSALLVNTARGDIIDEQALAAHIRSGHIRAILDVYEEEPLSMDSPLRNLTDGILLPHLGGPTIDRRPAAARTVFEDIQNLKNGLPLKNEISPSRAATMTRA